tara:strand:+ start:4161 stop:4553 length:393 start_codon:yes stop_codon:yes gene_type:complete
MKVSLKSRETICQTCRRRNRNAMVSQPYEEMSKGEIIRLLQNTEVSLKNVTDKVAILESKLSDMYVELKTKNEIKDVIKKEIENIAPEMKLQVVKLNNRIIKLENDTEDLTRTTSKHTRQIKEMKRRNKK